MEVFLCVLFVLFIILDTDSEATGMKLERKSSVTRNKGCQMEPTRPRDHATMCFNHSAMTLLMTELKFFVEPILYHSLPHDNIMKQSY